MPTTAIRADSPGFAGFGEVYFSCVYPGAIKAWHIHTEMVLNYAVPVGMIKLVLYDDREGSPTLGECMELFLGRDQYVRVTVPPRVWNGFKGIGTEMAIMSNCASIPHRPDEIHRLDPYDSRIPYDWKLRHG